MFVFSRMVIFLARVKAGEYDNCERMVKEIMGLLIAIVAIWLLWKLLKLSISILFWLIAIAVVAFFVKVLVIPALVLIGGIFAYGFVSN